MSKRLLKRISIGVGVCLILALGSFTFTVAQELTPSQWNSLSAEDKLEYKTITIKDHWFARFWQEQDGLSGVPEKLYEKISTGDLETPLLWYSKALFEIYNPKVKIEGVNYNMWGMESVMSSLAGGTAASFYQSFYGLEPPQWIEEGLVADITDLVMDWDQTPILLADPIVKAAWQDLYWRDGRVYGVPLDYSDIAVNAIGFRKDFFEEAGIFDESGEPGPPKNWTLNDLRQISKKLTDTKKQRWGFCFVPEIPSPQDTIIYPFLFNFGAPPWLLTIPDKSGKYTWKFNTTAPVVKTLQFLKDMMWEDKSMNASIDYISTQAVNTELPTGRAAMGYTTVNMFAAAVVDTPYAYSPTVPTSEILGVARVPQSELYGLFDLATLCGVGFNPTLNEEELKAAFDWWDWNVVGKGRTMVLRSMLDRRVITEELTPSANYPMQDIIAKTVGRMYQVREIPEGFPPLTDFLPADYMVFFEEMGKIPASPWGEVGPAGLQVPGSVEERIVLQGLLEELIGNPNFDIEGGLEKAANLLNSTLYNVKFENDREILKEAFTDLDNFYKEYYPEWYNSKEYKDLFENYYKTW